MRSIWTMRLNIIEAGKMVIKELEQFIDDLNCFSDLMELYDFPFECDLTWEGIAIEVENMVIEFMRCN